MKAPPIPVDARRFRMSIVPPMIFIFIGGLVIGYAMGICVLLFKYHSNIPWHLIPTIVAYSVPGILIYSFVTGLTVSLLFPSRIASNGIYGYSFGGSRNYLGWTEIARAGKIRLGNLVFLRLYDSTGRAMIWLPLFQSRGAEFQNDIRKFAPPNHPVLSHLS
ncbi:MAG TPA: hypothetical protein VGI03_05265 [Verrucomicrobiae bacterium]|jgi:hypothetical protein